ncbi:MAG: hypothetical protein WC539_09005 [Nitrospirota bacterium]
MKRFSFLFLLITLGIFVSACAVTPPRHMAFKEDPSFNIRSVKPEAGKAALIVARTISFGGAIEFDTYLDKKMIGVTQWKSYFVKTDITPGTHYVISKAENKEPAKIDFEPNKIYLMHQIPRIGVWKARVSIALVTFEQLLPGFDDSCRLLTYDSKNLGDDLSDSDFNEAVNDYERELREGRHQDHVSYRGLSVK